MSFQWYRKHEKTFLWVATILCVLILGLFSAFSDIEAWLQRGDSVALAEFEVAGTGETRRITEYDYASLARNMAKLGAGQLEEDAVFTHIMLLADAQAAGVSLSDADLGQAIKDILGARDGLTSVEYDNIRRQSGFASRRAFEEHLREQFTALRYLDLVTQEARIVGIDDVYAVWRIENERFDVDVVEFPDADLEAVGDPTDEQLQARWDEADPVVREARYREPDKQDVAYGVLALDTDLATLPQEKLLALAEPAESEILARFRAVQALRFEGQEAPDDGTRAMLAAELKLIALAQAAQAAFLEAETQDQATFQATMEAFGLRYEDPQGELDPEALDALDIGDRILPFYLRNLEVGQTHLVRPVRDLAYTGVVYVEAQVPSRPHTFEEAREALADEWREEQRRARAREFREAIVAATKALPDVTEEIAALEAGIEDNVAQYAADEPERDAEAYRASEQARVETLVTQRVDEQEARVWDDVVARSEVEPRRITGLTRNAAARLAADEDADPVEAFVARTPQVFTLGEGGITSVLYDAQGERSVVVRVAARSFPPIEAMKDDPDGLAAARARLADERARNRRLEFAEPELIKARHGFRKLEPASEPTPEG